MVYDKKLESFPKKKYYYSVDDFQFAELPSVTEPEDLAIIRAERNAPFSGDPDLVIGPQQEEEGEEEKKLFWNFIAWRKR